MITQDPTAPATKQDIFIIQQDLAKLLEAINYQGEALRGEMVGMRDELRGEMVGMRDELRGEMVGMRDELRGEMVGMRDELRGEMAQWAEHLLTVQDIRIRESEERMKDHFNLVAENLRYDMLGTHRDKIQSHQDQLQNHERRIKHLEQQQLVTPNS